MTTVSIVLLVITVVRVPHTILPTMLMALPKLMLLQLFVHLVIIVLKEHLRQRHIHVLLEPITTSLESNIPTNVQIVPKVTFVHAVSNMNHQANLFPISLVPKENFVPRAPRVRTKMMPAFPAALLVLFSMKEENGELKIVKNALRVNFVTLEQKNPKPVLMDTTLIVSESDPSPIVSFVQLDTNVTLSLVLFQYWHRLHVEQVFIQHQVQPTVTHVKKVTTVI